MWVDFNEGLKINNKTLGHKYRIIEHKSLGKSSNLYLGYDKKENTIFKVMVKIYNMRQIQSNQGFTRKETIRRLSNKEARIMSRITNQNILHCYKVYENWDYQIYVQDYCNMGTLKQQTKNKTHMSQLEIINIIKQIISGIKGLHQQKIIHGNLKPQHIFIKNGIYKIADLGLLSVIRREGDALQVSKPKQEEDPSLKNNFIIPEVINRQKITTKADVWAIGVLIYQLIYKQQHQNLRSTIQLQNFIYKNLHCNCSLSFRKNGYSKQLNELMSDCLTIDVKKRLQWQHLCSNPLFALQKAPLLMAPKMSFCCEINFELQNDIFSRLDDQLKQVECEMQKNYSKIGSNISLCSLINQNQLDRQEQEQKIYKKVITDYFQCLRTEFIFNQIILKLQFWYSLKKTKVNQRKWITFMFLLACRCFVNISVLKYNLSQDNYYINMLTRSIKYFTDTLYQNIKKNWQHYSQQLTKLQNKRWNILTDRMDKFLNEDTYQQTQKFITGIQNSDFTKQQQVGFTYNFYTSNILKYIPQYTQFRNLKTNLYNYININHLQAKNYQNYNSFQEMVIEEVLKPKSVKISMYGY